MSRVERLEALLKENRLEEAVTLAADSARAAPRDPETHNALGVVLARAGRYPEAERCYRAALRLDLRRGPIWSNLGNTLTAQGRDATAVAAQRRAVSLEPRNGTAFYNLATTLTRAERHGEAIPEYEEALQLGHPQAAWNLARAAGGRRSAPRLRRV